MEGAKHGHPETLKRKRGQDLENGTAKKPKIDVGLEADVKHVPQVRASGFFAKNQKPGFTAAPPTVSTVSTCSSC